MYLTGMHMISETTGWGVGINEDAIDFMRRTYEWSVFRTNDGGHHWEVFKSCTPSSDSIQLLSLPSFNTSPWVAIEPLLASLRDVTPLWDKLALPLASGESASLSDLTFLDAHTGWLIAHINQASAPPKTGPLRALFHTNDGGMSWSQLLRESRDSSSPLERVNEITFLTPTMGWMTAGALLLMTHDGGYTWHPQTLPWPAGVNSFSGLRLAKPRFFSPDDGILPACINGWPPHLDDETPNGFLVFVTHDGGQNWQSQPFVIKDYNHMYEEHCLAAEEKIMKTMKPGESFMTTRDLMYRMTPPPQFSDMQFGWVGLPSLEMSTTHDGGAHWEKLDIQLLPARVNHIQFINNRVGWGMMGQEDSASSATHLCKTTDGGKTWTRLIPVTP